MRFRHSLTRLLAPCVLLTVLLGCGAAGPAQPVDIANDPADTKVVQPTDEPARPAPSAPDIPETVKPAEVESELSAVEVGYKVGMHVPEFGMSLNDGTRVVSANLANQDRPTFLYFHATW